MDLNTPQDIDIIIARYLAREASAEETELLLRWIEASEANRRSFFEIQDTWHALRPPFAPEASTPRGPSARCWHGRA